MIQVTKVLWDGERLMAEPIDPTTIYQEPAQAKPDFWEGYVPEPVKPAQQALDKKAENARELGLDYEPAQPRAWFTIDELNAWAEKKLKENPQWAEQPAQQVVDSDEKAGAYMEARLWEFIDMAAAWPEAGPDPRTWDHVMVYAPKPAQQEPWGACVYGRVFVGRLPEHARKFSEDEGVPIQWLYTSPQPAQQEETINGRTIKVDWKAQALELRELVRLGGIKIAELEAALAEQPAQQEPACQWKREDDDHMPDTWRSDCGVMWTFTDGGPVDNEMKYCCGCGAILLEKST